MRILVADDEAVSRRLLAASLERMGHEVIVTSDGREAWEVLNREDIGLVVADWMMADMDGLELVRRIRSRALDHYVYVILLTSRSGKCDIVQGLEAGADDYITKPFEPDELTVRIKGGERVVGLERQLAEKNRELTALAMVDGLTGIGNRRSFDEAFARSVAHAVRFNRVLSVAMIDVDVFKRYNDRLGHGAGDEVLRSIGRILDDTDRSSDLVFRYGGEEFVAVLPETGAAGARVAAERMRRAIADARMAHPDNPPSNVVTVSIGVATMAPGSGGGVRQLLESADAALFCAKRNGRNRVEGDTDDAPMACESSAVPDQQIAEASAGEPR